MSEEMTTRQQLHWLREEATMSFAEIAREAGLSATTVRDLHTGRTNIGTQAVRSAVAKVYADVRADVLIPEQIGDSHD